MNEQDTQHSGSRWEPSSGATPTVPAPAAGPDAFRTAELPPLGAGQATYAGGWPTATFEHAMPGSTAPRRLPGWLRRRVVTGAAAVAMVAAGGVGGFAIVQAASGSDATVDSTVPDDGTGRDGFPGGRPDSGGGTPPGFGGGDTTTPDNSSTTGDGDPA